MAQKVVDRFGDLEAILVPTDQDLAAVDGVGEARAAEIREGLRRAEEVDAVDRQS